MDDIIKEAVEEKTKLFINSIDPAVICALASSHNGNRPCSLFSEPVKGSYNICYPVIFKATVERAAVQKWMVRIPLEPRVELVDEKLENEVAVMKFVQQMTTIPIPRIHGYAAKKHSPIGFAFMLIDFVDGVALSNVLLSVNKVQRTYPYNQLADIFVQLRHCEFPKVGSFSVTQDGSGWTFDRDKRPLSIDLIEQEVERLQPGLIVPPDRTYVSAKGYVGSLMQLAFNQFERGRNSVYNKFDATIALYDLHQFRTIAMNWASPVYEHGPFVLTHGDLRPQNIMVNPEDFTIVAIIDWEFGRTIPVQLLMPPIWLTGRELHGVYRYFEKKEYITELIKFREAVRVREENMPILNGHPLSEMWSGIENNYSFLIAGSLLSLTNIDTIYSKCLDFRHHGRDRSGRAEKFVSGIQDLQDLIDKKVADREEYVRELGLHGIVEETHDSPLSTMDPLVLKKFITDAERIFSPTS